MENTKLTKVDTSDLSKSEADSTIMSIDGELYYTKPSNAHIVNIKIKFVKTHCDAVLPKANNDTIDTGDSGYDIYSVEEKVIPANGAAVVDVGLKVGFVTPGYWMRVEARSGLSFKHNVIPHPGIFDNSYVGPCGVLLYNHSSVDYIVKKGDRIAQFVVYKLLQPTIEWVNEVQQTERGEKGFGSSGR